jgi:hypothetical protein
MAGVVGTAVAIQVLLSSLGSEYVNSRPQTSLAPFTPRQAAISQKRPPDMATARL